MNIVASAVLKEYRMQFEAPGQLKIEKKINFGLPKIHLNFTFKSLLSQKKSTVVMHFITDH